MPLCRLAALNLGEGNAIRRYATTAHADVMCLVHSKSVGSLLVHATHQVTQAMYRTAAAKNCTSRKYSINGTYKWGLILSPRQDQTVTQHQQQLTAGVIWTKQTLTDCRLKDTTCLINEATRHLNLCSIAWTKLP